MIEQGDERQQRQDLQRQREIRVDHHRDGDDERQNISGEAPEPDQQVAETFDIRGDPRQNLSDRDAVIERGGQPRDMGEQRSAKIAQAEIRDPRQHSGEQIGEQTGEGDPQAIEQGGPDQRRHACRGGQPIGQRALAVIEGRTGAGEQDLVDDYPAGDDRHQDRGRRGEHATGRCPQHVRAVGTEPWPQAVKPDPIGGSAVEGMGRHDATASSVCRATKPA